MKRLVVLFSGMGTNLAYILEHLHQKNGFEVVMVLTNNPNAKGIEIAKRYNIKIEIISNKDFDNRVAFDRVVADKISLYSPNLTILAGFMRILSKNFLSNIKECINIHPSILPLFKGVNAIFRSYHSDMKVGGVTVHKVTQEVDSGQILAQKCFEKENMSFEEFEKKIHQLEHSIYPDVILDLLKNNFD